jgi:ABC-2 type transport system ATP-binding protein
MNMEYAIETISLTKVFSDLWGRDKVFAVNDLNLQIRHNEVFGLLGPNGSGKTTTLKMLLGLLYPTKGRAVVLGGDSTDPKISTRIGFMPEESYLYQYLTARETLDFYGRLFALPAKVRKMRIESLLDMVGLRAAANRAVGTFSKGMARRIGLAQALINDPDLLILDEPTTGLDPIGTRQIKDLILQLAKRGKTILLCSHLLADVEDVCDRIAILYGGQIQSEGKVRELLVQSGRAGSAHERGGRYFANQWLSRPGSGGRYT